MKVLTILTLDFYYLLLLLSFDLQKRKHFIITGPITLISINKFYSFHTKQMGTKLNNILINFNFKNWICLTHLSLIYMLDSIYFTVDQYMNLNNHRFHWIISIFFFTLFLFYYYLVEPPLSTSYTQLLSTHTYIYKYTI